MKNNIRALRKQRGMTQLGLAKAAKTSQQQIQRIESGVQTVSIDLSVRICRVLGSPLEEVFPSAKQGRSSAKVVNLFPPKNSKEAISGAIDLEPYERTLRYLLRGGCQGAFEISNRTNDELYGAIQRRRDERFVVFDSSDSRVAINLDHLIYSHFMFEVILPGTIRGDVNSKEKRDEDYLHSLSIYIAGEKKPVLFGVDADFVDMEDNPEEEEKAQLQCLFYDLEHLIEENEMVSFVDDGGEAVWLRAADVAMVTAPLPMVIPHLYASVLEGDEEDEE